MEKIDDGMKTRVKNPIIILPKHRPNQAGTFSTFLNPIFTIFEHECLSQPGRTSVSKVGKPGNNTSTIGHERMIGDNLGRTDRSLVNNMNSSTHSFVHSFTRSFQQLNHSRGHVILMMIYCWSPSDTDLCR